MTRFIVVRHGFSTANKAEVFAGHMDVPLTEKGKRQAEYTAEYLAAHERIDKILYSDMTRTRQTAEPTARRFNLTLHKDASLRELFAGAWEGMTYEDIDRLYHEDWRVWEFDFSHARCTMGESVREHYFRIRDAIHRIAAAHDGKTVMLVTHCTPVRVMNALAAGIPPERVNEAELPLNASINIYSYEDGTLTAEKTNIIAFPMWLSSSKRLPPPPLMPKKK